MIGIVGVTDAINAKLATTLAALTLVVPQFRFGQDQLAFQEAPPRICWVPKRGQVDANIKPAPDHQTQFGVTTTPYPPVNPRPLWRRKLGFEAHVWAIRDNPTTDLDAKKDYIAAELLGNHLVAAVHDLMYGSYAVTSEDWSTTQASAQRFGAVLVVGLELHLAWSRETDTYAVVTALPINPEGT